MKKIENREGFTLVELIIVIAILAVLASIAVPNLLGSVEKSRIAKDEANAKLIGDALVMTLANGDLPSNFEIDSAVVNGNNTTMQALKKTIDPLPRPTSKKYKSTGNGAYFWYTVADGKVTVFTVTQTTRTQLYPSVEDPVNTN